MNSDQIIADMFKGRHIIPSDGFGHIESSACYCGPSLTVSEGEYVYIHNNMDITTKIKDPNVYEG